MAEWSIAHAWKVCKPHGFMGSNPIPSTKLISHYFSESIRDTLYKPFIWGFYIITRLNHQIISDINFSSGLDVHSYTSLAVLVSPDLAPEKS